jgi:atypical dual specificity phosphatase
MEEQLLQPIRENLWWVRPGQLAGVRKPLPTELPELEAMGIGAIVSVMDDPANLDAYEQANIPYRWLPTKGGTAPTLTQIQDLKAFVDEQNQAGKAVAIHCTSGNRRTGTMLAAYLICTGTAYEDAMQVIQRANPNAELREAQLTFLRSLDRMQFAPHSTNDV